MTKKKYVYAERPSTLTGFVGPYYHVGCINFIILIRIGEKYDHITTVHVTQQQNYWCMDRNDQIHL